MAVIFADGMSFEKPREGSPDFVKGRISVNVKTFTEFLEKNKNEKGWINIDLLKSKKGSLYLALNQWKKEDKKAVPDDPVMDL